MKFWLDCRAALRSASVRRGSTAAVVLVVAIGIGLATAMFALTAPFVLRPLSYANAGALVAIEIKTSGIRDIQKDPLIPTLDDWRANTTLFESVAAYSAGPAARLPGGGYLAFYYVTENFFDVLGVKRPASSAWKIPDGSTGSLPLLLTSTGRRLLESDSGELRSQFESRDGRVFRVAGLLPDTFLFPNPRSLRVPALAAFDGGRLLPSAGCCFRTVIARLRPGVTFEAVARQLATPLGSGKPLEVKVASIDEQIRGSVRPLAWGALGASVLLLIICAGNVANLLAAKAVHRRGEFATRVAIGAARVDLLRLWFVEVTLTTTLAAVAGLGIAWGVLKVAAVIVPPEYATLGLPALSWRAIVFGCAAALAVTCIALVPVVLTLLTAETARGKRAGRLTRTLRGGFAGAQATLAVVLAVGASMLVHSYITLIGQNPGYRGDVLSANVSYPLAYPAQARSVEVQATMATLRRLPGVESVAASAGEVVGDGQSKRSVILNGGLVFTDAYAVTPEFFETAGLSILQGRALRATDARFAGVVVTRSFARTHWPDGSAIGQHVTFSGAQGVVVGVVEDALAHGLDRAATPTLYSTLDFDDFRSLGVKFVVRVTGDPSGYVAPIQRTLAERSMRDADIGSVATIDERLSETVRDRTFATLVLAIFATAGVVISLAGLVGIVTFLVARRTKELALRVALGAPRRHIVRLVVSEALLTAAVGGLAGLLIGRWLSRGLESLVFGIQAGDWRTALVGAVAAMLVMGLASLVPAWRALRLSPTEALRVD